MSPSPPSYDWQLSEAREGKAGVFTAKIKNKKEALTQNQPQLQVPTPARLAGCYMSDVTLIFRELSVPWAHSGPFEKTPQ